MPSPDLAAISAAFGQLLHGAGIPVTPERSSRFATAITVTEPQTLDDLYWLASVTLLTSHEDKEVFDRVFRQVFAGMVRGSDLTQTVDQPEQSPTGSSEHPPRDGHDSDNPGIASSPQGTSATPGHQGDRDSEQQPSVLAAVSTDERLHERDFASLTEQELALLARLVEQLPLVPPHRTARRLKRNPRGKKWDVRATLRQAHKTGGEPVAMVFRAPTTKPRRIIMLADVSGSMEPYARIYLHLMRGAVRALGAEAFVFATHLTRLTPALASAQADVAYRKAVKSANDWSGGTRIGRSLKHFIDTFGRRGMARGAVVVIVSDGWEIDDPSILGESMQRLARLAHHIIWVNPRKAAAGYQPLVGGMAAALPSVDTFISGHSMSALEDVMAAIHAAGERSFASTTRAS